MKIVSWNVNGIRAAFKKGLFDWVSQEAPDIFCLQETKAHPDQIAPDQLETLGYVPMWAICERKGYSGVATYSREKPKKFQEGLGVPEFDREGRVMTTWFSDFVLVNVYVPNGQPDHARVPFKMAFCDALLTHLEDLKKECPNVVTCGDYNIAHKPIDLKHPVDNKNTTGFLPVEREWLDKLFDHGYDDVFRSFEPGPDHYTWWTYRLGARERNIGWRIDYFFTSECMKSNVKSAAHQPEVMGSDHCPVTLELTF